MRLPRLFSAILLAGASLWASAADGGIVAASAGIAPCVESLIKAFTAQGAQNLALVRESTGTIVRQMDQGAPYDVLVAADPEWPKWLADRGKLTGLKVCATGSLALWVARGEAPKLDSLGGLVIACPDPATTSHGKLGQKFLVERKLWDSGKQSKHVLIVANAVQGVVSVKGGAAQAALVPLSLARKSGGAFSEVPGSSIPTTAGLSTHSSNANAKAFLAFLTSPAAAPIWHQWGFETPAK